MNYLVYEVMWRLFLHAKNTPRSTCGFIQTNGTYKPRSMINVCTVKSLPTVFHV